LRGLCWNDDSRDLTPPAIRRGSRARRR